jgi:hypothetical protein
LAATSQNVKRLITEGLAANDLKRFGKTIPSQLAENFQRLENGGWQEALAQYNRLIQPTTWETEEEVADYIDNHFVGFGPKQARYVPQALGLTRYEIPIDSRVTNWLNDILHFPVRLSSIALADVEYYKFVQSGIRELCEACDLFPCIFDAAVFSLKHGEGWQESDFAF